MTWAGFEEVDGLFDSPGTADGAGEDHNGKGLIHRDGMTQARPVDSDVAVGVSWKAGQAELLSKTCWKWT